MKKNSYQQEYASAKNILYIHPYIFLSFALYKNVWRLAFKYVS